MVRKLAFVSDIHSNIEAFQSVLHDIEERKINIEDVYCLGDSVGYGTRPNEVIEMLKELNIKSVLGNHDGAVSSYLPTSAGNKDNEIVKTIDPFVWTAWNTSLNNKEYIGLFDEHISLQVNDFKILLTHGSPLSISDYIFEDDLEKQEKIAGSLDEDIIIFGHTHCPYAKKVKNKLFINAGSVGRPKDGDNRACYCILEFGEKLNVQFIRVSYDIEKIANEIEQTELPDSFARVLRNGHDRK